MQNGKRIVNLQLFSLDYPITAVVSILHRISGIFLVLLIPALLWCLQYSLTAPGFQILQDILGKPLSKLLFFGFLLMLGYHLLAGIRHMLMDLHFADSKKGGIVGAWLLLVVVGLFAVFGGYLLWK